jgi:hypothetical protein
MNLKHFRSSPDTIFRHLTLEMSEIAFSTMTPFPSLWIFLPLFWALCDVSYFSILDMEDGGSKQVEFRHLALKMCKIPPIGPTIIRYAFPTK